MKTQPAKHRSLGFTLIELMITVSIVAILTAIAMPNYRNYVIRGQFVDATNGLSALRANMERYFQDNRSYATIGAIKSPCDPTNTVTGYPVISGTFTLTCTIPDATHYNLFATGTASPLSGFVFTVDQQGNQATTVTTPPAPAAFLGCTTAWITKTGGC